MKWAPILVLVFTMGTACEKEQVSPPVKEAPAVENLYEPRTKPSAAAANLKPIPDWAPSVILPVQGMTCEGCEMAINETLEKMDGVFRSGASHKDGNVKVHYDHEKTKPALFVNAINELGYRAHLLTGDPDLVKVKPQPVETLQGHEKVGKPMLDAQKAK